ncbi:DNA topoisomerase 2 [Neonectria magnoliae]|uniref:DNA topoisomerase 2 n=1 Tax=Neonectria magnoliae TaxID=2732573 RepID=A0ABR1IFG7_9HYPO
MDLDTDPSGDSFGAGDDFDVFPPEKPKAKTIKKKAPAAKKGTTASSARSKSGKRPSDEMDDDDDFQGSALPPKTKQLKNTTVAKKPNAKPAVTIKDDMVMSDTPDTFKPKFKKTVDEKYQKLTLLEHILKRPDTYIGSIVRTESEMWVLDKETKQMDRRKITYVPGLYKIFDEILVNAADNKQGDDMDHTMTYIKVTVDRSTGEITVENNGNGIPVMMHSKEAMYVPQMIFGHLLTGSNYDDDEKKTVGGRNGYGAKLCNVFSTQFTVEIQDSENGKRYKQTWTDNMTNAGKPKISSSKTANFVRISFRPDFTKFNMPDGIDDDLESLLYRRVYDLAGTVHGIKVFLNGAHIKLGFKGYCEMYAKAIGQERSAEEGSPASCTVILDDNKAHARWEVAFAVSDGSFQQVSFVNSIATTTGGTHVNYIADQITDSLLTALTKKRKGHALKQNHIRNHIFIFVNCFINNPAFTSQTKEQMTTKVSQFGSKCSLTDGFLKKVAASDALKNIMDFAERKADKMMAKSDGNKRSRISNAKLVDANLAGTRRGHECTLILTEGDSAKGLAVSGRAILDPDRIGVFPLRGKMLNVRDASIDQITKNQEIQNIKQFLGLKHKQVYTDTKGLRYGHLMIMADQDHDGSHIKGLLINFLQVQFPSLLRIPDFFREFITPVVKVWQGSNPKKPQKLKSFFNLPQFEEWKEAHASEISRWHSKYFKGLGTSSNEDAQVYFTNLDEHLKEFDVMQPEETQLFDLAFSKKKADARKEWLGNFVPGTYLDHTTKSITYDDFVNKELILFSMADNIRSIPSVIDGLKPGQRKVLYATFKRNLTKDQKVIELAGYVSEQTAYHHGEVSLQQTIIGLAQTFVGSNNVNCLEPSGNFGSRLAGGSDAASPRYIHTRLSPFARKIFSVLDEPNLEHQYDDGSKIEPKTYAPVIPMILVNGADGIGTGWSTSIPNYNPVDIVDNLRRRMGRLEDSAGAECEFQPMQPWFRGWKGVMEPAGPDRYKFNGVIQWDETVPNEVIITELPIRMWTDDMKAKLEEIISGAKGPAFIKDYKEFNDHKTVRFEIQLDEKHMKNPNVESLREQLKLNKQVAISNIVAFDTVGRIRKYEKVEDILEEFYHFRLDMYSKRKVKLFGTHYVTKAELTNRQSYWLGVYHADYRKLQNQVRFIREIIDGALVVAKKKKEVLVTELREKKYEPFRKGKNGEKSKPNDEDVDASDDEDGEGSRDYDYLLSMPIWALTQERLDKLNEQIRKKKDEYDALDILDEKDLWCSDLDQFVAEWETQLKLDAEIQTTIRRMGRRVSKKIGAGKSRGKQGDNDYEPSKGKASKTAPRKKKVAEQFADTFNAEAKPQIKMEGGTDDLENFSDDDLAALSRKRAPSNTSGAVHESASGRSKRAAANKPKAWGLSGDGLSESDGSDVLDDIDQLVKGISEAKDATPSSRLSRISLSRSEQNSIATGTGRTVTLPKPKAKSARAFMVDSDDDDTNYEILARSSPKKPPTKTDENFELDSFLSDDAPPPKSTARARSTTADKSSQPPLASRAASNVASVKKRGRPAGTKNKLKNEVAKKPSGQGPATLPPAASAFAVKKSANNSDKRSDSDQLEPGNQPPESPSPRAAVRRRPGRAAAAKAKFVISDDDDSDQDESDPFAMDESD